MKYPDRDLVVEVVNEVARRAAVSSSSRHPEDIASAMSIAVEYAGETLTVLFEKGRL